MRIHLDDPDVLEGDTAAELVIALLWSIGDGRHVFAVADRLLERVRTLLTDATTGSFRRRLEEALDRAVAERDSVDRTVVPGKRPPFPHAEVARTSNAIEHCVFTIPPERVKDWLHEPLFLLTENDIDAELVIAASRGLGRDVLLAAMEREWVRVNGRGGTGEIPPRLHRSHPLERLFVLVDSDRNTWEGPIAVKAEEIRGLCESAGIPCHVLRRREAENHLPLALLNSSATLQGRASPQLKRGVRALEKLPAHERWVIPLDHFFADQQPKGRVGRHWANDRCKSWLRELLPECGAGRAEFEPEALEHLTGLLDELERWL